MSNKINIQFHPILFSTEMVKAILAGNKTQTRRVVKPQIKDCTEDHKLYVEADWKNELFTPSTDGLNKGRLYCALCGNGTALNKDFNGLKLPYGRPGDVLWVREKSCYVMLEHAHDLLEGFKEARQTVYQTDFHSDWMRYAKEKYGYKWQPSIHMPKTACRLFLQIKNIRVERLQDITEDDAKAEGINQFTKDGVGFNYGIDGWHWSSATGKPFMCRNRVVAFEQLWISINGEESWNNNPWVWVIEFERIKKPQNFY